MGRFMLRRLMIPLRQYVPLRRLRTIALVGVVLATVALVGVLFLQGPPPTSAIGCKNKLAEFLWPRKEDRKKALEGLGQDTLQLEKEYYGFLSTLTRQCHDQMHFGPEEDGGWEACMDRSYGFREPCLVYSFGVGHDFRFEESIEKKLGCEVHAFDPSMGVPSHQYSEKGHFYDTGIDNINGFAVNGKWRMKRLERIMKELNHTEKHIDYMKMDVEFNEWTALYDIIKSGLASRIRQLAVEFHTPEMDIHVNPTHKCTWTKHETLAAMLTVLHGLRNEGFSVYYSSINYRTQFISLYSQQQQYCCYNVHLVNTKHPMNAWRPPPPGRRQRH